jgi:predicted nuclease of restriction endonuclease-like (RecB) superfamily
MRVVNKKLVSLYWEIGKTISEKTEKEGWGKSTVQKLAKDLDIEFPGIRGFSIANLWNMKKFYETFSQNEKLQTVSVEIGWSQNLLILKLKTDEEKLFYMMMTQKFGWSVRMLERQIESDLFSQAEKNQTNFEKTLSKDRAVLASLNVKDDYNFDFLDISEKHLERELEDELINKICDFLKELGGSFAFIDRQYRVEIEGDEFFIDLLFYNREMQCLVAVDLKVGEFKAEYASKMNLYLSALNDKKKLPHEKNSIGIIICKSKDRTIVEYTLDGMTKPLGVATYSQYENLEKLPERVSKYLPGEEEIIKKLAE